MTSKIIQKEKERQDEFLKTIPHIIATQENIFRRISEKKCHKQSLINLKEYMEGEIDNLVSLGFCCDYPVTGCGRCRRIHARFNKVKKDIQELNKMIERYE